jgi:hypothetical protein
MMVQSGSVSWLGSYKHVGTFKPQGQFFNKDLIETKETQMSSRKRARLQ